jgi:hypothetical protein
MSPDPAAALAKVRAICLALPDADERLSHGSPGFFISAGKKGGKFFAYFWHNHHNDGETIAIVKTAGRDEQAMLIEADPDFYFSPPYMGPSGWIAMRLDGDDLDLDRVADRIAMSWEMVAPRRLLEGRA